MFSEKNPEKFVWSAVKRSESLANSSHIGGEVAYSGTRDRIGSLTIEGENACNAVLNHERFISNSGFGF